MSVFQVKEVELMSADIVSMALKTSHMVNGLAGSLLGAFVVISYLPAEVANKPEMVRLKNLIRETLQPLYDEHSVESFDDFVAQFPR